MDLAEPAQLQLLDEPSNLRRLLFRHTGDSTTTGEIIRWWESRRILYNTVVGGTGVLTLVAANLLMLSSPGPRGDGIPFFLPVIYGVAANVCFTGGWIAELALRPLFGRRTPVVGAALFRYGLAFSVGLTALPICVFSFAFVARWLSAIFSFA